jgi:putative ABC transport system permease protein
MSTEEAIRRARLTFGGPQQITEQCRAARGTRVLTGLEQDLRYGVRMIFKDRSFSVVAILILALGIGATTVMFAVVDAVLIRPLAYKSADRLVFMTELYERRAEMSFSYANLRDLESQNSVFSSVGGSQPRYITLTGTGLPQQLYARCATRDWFRTLGISMVLGRDFTAQDDTESAAPTVILGYEFWQRQFGGDHAVLGRNITLNQRSYTVIGIAPANAFYRNQQPDIYVPLTGVLTPEERTRRSAHGGTYTVARLKDGVTLDQARSNVDLITDRWQRQFPDTEREDSINVRPLRDYINGSVRTGLLILLSAVGLLLLIACANVANLALARASSRSGELAIRVSLGASRARIVTQMLTESVLLAGFGGMLGVLLAFWGTRYLVHSETAALPRIGEITLSGSVLAFAVVITIATGILFGALPAWHVSRSNINAVLKHGTGPTAGAERQRLRAILIVGELALSFTLLAGAGLLVRSFMHVLQVDPGFNPHNVLTASVVIPTEKYPTPDSAERVFTEILRNVRAIPGVVSAANAVPLPLSGNEWDEKYLLEGQTISHEFQGVTTEISNVQSDFISTMQIPVLRGRAFTHSDLPSSLPVVVVNEAFARKNWPNQDALGKRVHMVQSEDVQGGGKPYVWRTVVGVIGNVRQYGLDDKIVPTVYLPLEQPDDMKTPLVRRDLVIRTATDPLSIAEQVRRAVAAADPDQAVSDFETMDQYVSESIASRRLYVSLLSLFAAAAVLLASIGIYGVIAYWVGERRREIGIRIAVGAQPQRIFRLVLGRSLRLIIFGTVIGGIASVALAQGLRSLLFGVHPMDAAVFSVVATVLTVVALFASYIPARSATRISPTEALRYE